MQVVANVTINDPIENGTTAGRLVVQGGLLDRFVRMITTCYIHRIERCRDLDVLQLWLLIW
jgi:hypothetical protein